MVHLKAPAQPPVDVAAQPPSRAQPVDPVFSKPIYPNPAYRSRMSSSSTQSSMASPANTTHSAAALKMAGTTQYQPFGRLGKPLGRYEAIVGAKERSHGVVSSKLLSGKLASLKASFDHSGWHTLKPLQNTPSMTKASWEFNGFENGTLEVVQKMPFDPTQTQAEQSAQKLIQTSQKLETFPRHQRALFTIAKDYALVENAKQTLEYSIFHEPMLGGSIANPEKPTAITSTPDRNVNFETALGIVKSIHALHQHDLFLDHVEPRDFLLTDSGHVKFANLASIVDQNQQTTTATATPFQAPEALLTNDYKLDGSNAFALGVMLYELATGQHPLDAYGFDATQHTNDSLSSNKRFVQHCDAAIDLSSTQLLSLKIIALQLLHPNPEQRINLEIAESELSLLADNPAYEDFPMQMYATHQLQLEAMMSSQLTPNSIGTAHNPFEKLLGDLMYIRNPETQLQMASLQERRAAFQTVEGSSNESKQVSLQYNLVPLSRDEAGLLETLEIETDQLEKLEKQLASVKIIEGDANEDDMLSALQNLNLH